MDHGQQHERAGEREPPVAVGRGEQGELGQAAIQGDEGARLARGAAEALPHVVGQ